MDDRWIPIWIVSIPISIPPVPPIPLQFCTSYTSCTSPICTTCTSHTSPICTSCTSQQVPPLPLVPLPRIPLVLTCHVLQAPPSPEEEPPSQHDDTSEVRAYVLSRPLLLLRWSLPSLQELTDGEVRSILNDIKSTRLQLAEELQVSNTSHTSPFCTSCTSHTSLICTSHTSPICTFYTSQTSPICTSCTSTGEQ